jgi:hypothetical protein
MTHTAADDAKDPSDGKQAPPDLEAAAAHDTPAGRGLRPSEPPHGAPLDCRR